MGEHADDARDEYYERMFDTFSNATRSRREIRKNWHSTVSALDADCGDNQWRTRDREVVIDIRALHDTHLLRCIYLASRKKNHSTKLIALLDEQLRRMKTNGR